MTNKYQVLRSLTSAEYESLKNSIREVGVNVPILLDEDKNIINGHHRKRIYEELQAEGVSLPPLPTIVKIGLTEEQKISLAYELNITGRQLSPEEVAEMRSRSGRRKAAEESLKQSPQMADNWHAQQTGISKNTVAVVREELEGTCQIDRLNRLTGSDGKERPRQISKPVTIYNPTTVEVEAVKQFVDTAPPEAIQAVADGKTDVWDATYANQKLQKPEPEPDYESERETIRQNTDKAFSTIYDRVLYLREDYSNIAECLLENPNRTRDSIVENINECVERLQFLKAAVLKTNNLRMVK